MRVILPQMAQITQRGMQQAALFRRERQFCVVSVVLCGSVVLGFCLRKSARSAGDIEVSFDQYRLSTLA